MIKYELISKSINLTIAYKYDDGASYNIHCLQINKIDFPQFVNIKCTYKIVLTLYVEPQ